MAAKAIGCMRGKFTTEPECKAAACMPDEGAETAASKTGAGRPPAGGERGDRAGTSPPAAAPVPAAIRRAWPGPPAAAAGAPGTQGGAGRCRPCRAAAARRARSLPLGPGRARPGLGHRAAAADAAAAVAELELAPREVDAAWRVAAAIRIIDPAGRPGAQAAWPASWPREKPRKFSRPGTARWRRSCSPMTWTASRPPCTPSAARSGWTGCSTRMRRPRARSAARTIWWAHRAAMRSRRRARRSRTRSRRWLTWEWSSSVPRNPPGG